MPPTQSFTSTASGATAEAVSEELSDLQPEALNRAPAVGLVDRHTRGGIHPTDVAAMPDPRKPLIRFLGSSYLVLAVGLSVTVALPQVREQLPMSDTVTSLHGSFFGWALLGVGLFGARHIVRVGRLRALLVGMGTVGLGAAVFGTATSSVQSLTGAGLVGIGAAIVVVAVPGLIAEHFPTDRQRVFSRLNAVPAIGGSAFVLSLAGALALGWSWRLPVIAIPVVTTGAAIAIYARVPSTMRQHAGVAALLRAADIVGLLRVPAVRDRFVLQVVQITIEFAVGAWAVVYLKENAGMSSALAPIGAALWSSAMLVARLRTTQLVRVAGHRFEAFAMAGAAVGSLLLLNAPFVVVQLLSLGLVSFAIGPLYALGVERMFLAAEHAGHADAGAMSGLAAMASGVGVTLGPVIVGTLADRFGLPKALLYAPFAATICAVVSLLHWRGEAGMIGQRDHRRSQRA